MLLSPPRNLMNRIVLTVVCLLASRLTAETSSTLPVSYYSRAAPDYHRKSGPDGRPLPEYYAISYGGRVDGTVWDQTQSREDFPKIAGIVAEQLARQNYHFAPDAKAANLLITIHWGRTNPAGNEAFNQRIGELGTALNNLSIAQQAAPPPGADSPEGVAGMQAQVAAQNAQIAEAQAALEGSLALTDMENRVRNRRNEDTARVLGYVDEMADKQSIGGFVGGDRFNELREEIEDPRYYIVLTAYDFKLATQKQKKKVLWTSRISIRTRGNRFDKSIETMVARAANTFGRNSGRLVRDYKGEVEIGDLKVMGEAESPPAEPTNP